jgi:hypothetical protein
LVFIADHKQIVASKLLADLTASISTELSNRYRRIIIAEPPKEIARPFEGIPLPKRRRERPPEDPFKSG